MRAAADLRNFAKCINRRLTSCCAALNIAVPRQTHPDHGIRCFPFRPLWKQLEGARAASQHCPSAALCKAATLLIKIPVFGVSAVFLAIGLSDHHCAATCLSGLQGEFGALYEQCFTNSQISAARAWLEYIPLVLAVVCKAGAVGPWHRCTCGV